MNDDKIPLEISTGGQCSIRQHLEKKIDMAGVQQEDRQLILEFYATKDCGLRPKQPDRQDWSARKQKASKVWTTHQVRIQTDLPWGQGF